MSSQLSPSSSSSAAESSRTSSPTSDAPHPSSPPPPPEDDLPDFSPPSSPKATLIASPPLDSRPYSAHSLGIGILSPQPVLGPFAPISRANFSPLQVRSSPIEQRANPLDPLPSPHHPPPSLEPLALRASGSRSPEKPQSSPPPHPTPRYVDDRSDRDGTAGEHIPLTTFSSASAAQNGLRIAIPPPHPTASTSTPSPPLFSQHTEDPVASATSSILDHAPSGPILETPAAASTVDILAPSADLNIDFTEFDTEGYNALEKIYLFSRSRASFHRVFIAHALPKYLLGGEAAAAELPSREIIEQITPADAVEYVLPLLNGLAMDEDEAVKEALAAELVHIIWWFITHCKVVEDDGQLPPSPPAPSPLSAGMSPVLERSESSAFMRHSVSQTHLLGGEQDVLTLPAHLPGDHEHDDEPTVIPVQAFTPILGTLLLSPNGTVGGSAKYAVVELLRRLRRAEQQEPPTGPENGAMESEGRTRACSPTPSESEYQEAEDLLDFGLLQREERRLFERELVYQVVIGMGRLDVDDNRADLHLDDGSDFPPDSGPSTAVPTPQPNPPTSDPDSYFPVAAPTGLGLTAVPPAMSTAPTASPPVGPAELGLSTLSPNPSPSPPVSSTSSLTGSPGYSCASTPSLTSSTSSSSGEYPDNTELDGLDRLGLNEPAGSPSLDEVVDDDDQFPMEADGSDEVTVTGTEAKSPTTEETWAAPGPLSGQAALPTTPPFEVPPPPVAAPVPVAVAAGLPMFQVQSPSSPSPARETPPRQASVGWLSPRSAARELEALEEPQPMDDGSDLSEEASVGRLSSMSLMAAVTHSGSISEETKRAFVAEVERVGRDPVYWVRREASFAVGALAKVVPVEVVTSSLLPLFECLCQDATWHVRHSVLFALPAILSRLTPQHRRELALDVIMQLSQDEESTVRSAVLEAVGEVMHTFVDDEDGPPEQLLKLFLGIRETDDPGGGTPARPSVNLPAPSEHQPAPPRSTTSAAPVSSAWSDYGTDAGGGPDIYDDPQRPLVCAFNYPAVALTLGRDRWPELRSLYLTLAQDPSFKIRRTLAASLGEMAKIVGEEHARTDLMDVFWSSLRAEESEVRMKLVEALQTFLRALGRPERARVADGFEDAFSSGKMSSWRERESAIKALGGLVDVEGVDGGVLKRMLAKALDDRVAAVREAAVSVLPVLVKAWRGSPELLEPLRTDVRAFASSGAFRRRTTWVTCVQELLVQDQGDVVVRNETFWGTLGALVHDPIVDVRIRVARLLSLISDKFARVDSRIADKTVTLAQGLMRDASHEVQAFATAIVVGAPSARTPPPHRPPPLPGLSPRVERSAATFSRPPPPSPS